MAGSEKLYLQPILKELLDGINAAMSNVSNIVDGLGDSVGDMKDAVDQVQTIVDGVSDTLEGVQTTIETTNSKLDTLNQSIGETKEIIVTSDSYYVPGRVIGGFEIDVPRGRYEQGEEICRFSSMANGQIRLYGSIHGTSGVNPNNPGLLLIDEVTNISLELLEHADNSEDQMNENLTFGVVAGHTYKLVVESNGASGEDIWIAQNYACKLAGRFYYLFYDDQTQDQDIFIMGGIH